MGSGGGCGRKVGMGKGMEDVDGLVDHFEVGRGVAGLQSSNQFRGDTGDDRIAGADSEVVDLVRARREPH